MVKKTKPGKSYKKPKTSKHTNNTNMIGGHTHKVSFNFKKNHVEKFYCPNLPDQEKSSIDLNSIEDFPEIPLNDLLNTL
jgi:hypothetical protein